MTEIRDNNLVFAFPAVNPSAELRIHYRRADASQALVPLVSEPIDGAFLLAGQGPLVMHLRPKVAFEESWYGSGTQKVRYPFAILLTVGGVNALTGERSSLLVRSPQNYFVSPPQGGIDGYFVGGRVMPFRAGEASRPDSTRLEVKVFPVKSETWAHWMHQKSLVGWGHAAISGLTLAHGGERECEPIYEDLCCNGDWDQSRGAKASVWLKAGS
jgi:hypothetical protein